MMTSIFDDLKEKRSLVCLWQIHLQEDGSSKRLVHHGFISGFTQEIEMLQIEHDSGKNFDFTGDTIFLYSEHFKFTFKTILLQSESGLVTISYPKEMLVMDDAVMTAALTPPVSYLEKYNLMRGSGYTEKIDDFMKVRGHPGWDKETSSAPELSAVPEATPENQMNQKNAKFFLGMRASPRIAPKDDKYVLVRRENGQEKLLRLLDLSRGGAGVALADEDVLNKGEKIEFLAIDSEKLNPTLKGEVVAIRLVESDGIYKAGIKFVVEEAKKVA